MKSEARARSAGWFVVFAAAALLSGCASSGTAPVARPMPAANAAPLSTDVDPHEYVIGPGDQLRLFVLNNPDLTADVSVRPDGKISAPLVNEMMAVGKTPAQLGLDLQDALKEFVRTPTVSVIVSNARSALSQVRVVGQAVSPRALPFRKNMTVLDLVIEVGGLSPFAAGNRAKIVRSVDGKSQEIRVRLNDLIDGGDMSQNVMLAPGDVLIVPQTRF
jgi:polysaccharide export outer membrane protein